MRVVITGMGVVSAAGSSLDALWDNVSQGCTAITQITRFDTSAFKAKLAAEIKDFNPDLYVSDPKEVRRLDRYCQYAIASTKLAVEDSGINFADFDPTMTGVLFGTGIGGIETMENEKVRLLEKGSTRVSPLFVPMMIANIACGNISKEYNIQGPSYCPVSACATGAHAIGEAFRYIKHGYADRMIAGGSEAAITPLSVAGFTTMTALSTSDNPNQALLPFDARRKGFIMGEGSGTVMLESYDSAVKRGAKIYAEIVGYGATSDAYHITSPRPDGLGAANAMRFAMREAGIPAEQVSYINAHGTGTPINDKFETIAIKEAMGADLAYKIPVSSTKGVTGHTLGAAGAIEAIICAQALTKGVIPPTANLLEQDAECDLDCVPLTAREAELEYVLSNSFGFGGTNASLLIKKFK